VRDSMPAVAALHPLNGFLILALGILPLAWQVLAGALDELRPATA
jgi:hypothetical protein